MSESSGKFRKSYVDHWKDWSKLTYLFRGPGNSSYGRKFLGDFRTYYDKGSPTKDRRQGPATKKSLEDINKTII